MLRGVGAMIALPQLEIMAKSTGAATSSATPGHAPMRFITVFQPNGVYPKNWDVKGSGSGYKMSPILEPLEPFRDDINIISGVNSVGKGHVSLTSSFLTGVDLRKGTAAESLDQKIAKLIGEDTRYESITLGTEAPRQGRANGHAISIASTVSWSSKTTRISPEINPRIAFDRMFRGKTGAAAIEEAELQKSVLDLVMDDAKSLRRKASYLDKEKLDEYLESLRSVESQIEKTLNPVESDWIPPTTPGESDLKRPPAGIPRERDVHLRLMMDIIVLGLWTDSTRVCSLMTAHGFSRQNFSFIDGIKNDHHTISHHKNIASKTKDYTTVSRWYVTQVAYLIKRLKSIDEGGTSILDNSLLLYGCGMKDGNGHIKNNLPLVLAGNAQGKLKTGNHINVKNQPMHNLHYTIGEKFGLEAQDFSQTRSSLIPELS